MSQSSSPDSSGHDVVICDSVFKQFYIYQHRTTSVREWFIRAVRGQPLTLRHAEFTLRNLDLRIARGEVVAIVGRNGSGKSTALRLIAGIYRPTSGKVETFGRVAAVIELGAGFSGELTGAENIDLYGAIMGLDPDEISRHRGDIRRFADLGEFIDLPVKYYSSGMVARLAFSVAICVEPDILLLDEVLAVGDQAFQAKCIDRLMSFKDSGGTMVVVSHDAGMLRRLCSRAVWMERGTMRLDGPVAGVLAAYEAASAEEAAVSADKVNAESAA